MKMKIKATNKGTKEMKHGERLINLRGKKKRVKITSLLFAVAFAFVGAYILIFAKAVAGPCSTADIVGTSTYSIDVPETGRYRLWVRMKLPDTVNTDNTNGIRVELGGSQCFHVTSTDAGAVSNWKWINSSATSASTPHITTPLTAGSINAKIYGLKDDVKVDKVLLLEQSNTCIPSNDFSVGQPGDNCLIAPNTAPVVNAGTDTSVSLANPLSLSGTVTDDGLPSPPGSTTATWSKVSGPGTTTFSNASSVSSSVSFSAIGTYTLRLSATDGALSSTDNVVVTVTNPVDTERPIITLTSVPSGILTGASTITLTAIDNEGVNRVELRRKDTNALVSSDTNAPYELDIPLAFPNGTFPVEVVALDDAGNAERSSEISIIMRNPNFNRDLVVDYADLQGIINHWNQGKTTPPTDPAYDLNNDGTIGYDDLSVLITAWTR